MAVNKKTASMSTTLSRISSATSGSGAKRPETAGKAGSSSKSLGTWIGLLVAFRFIGQNDRVTDGTGQIDRWPATDLLRCL